MVFWDRTIEYKKHLDSEEQNDLMELIVKPSTLHNLKRMNLFFNIIIPIIIYNRFGLNLFYFGIAFILFDIAFCTMSNLFFKYIPYKRMQTSTVTDAQKNIEIFKKEKESISKEISRLRQKYCVGCNYSGYRYSECISCSTMKRLHNDLSWFDGLIDSEQEYVKKELNAIEEKESMTNNKTSRDYSDKLEYLNKMKNKMKYFIKNKNMEFLKPIKDSLNTLINTLNKKPVGFSLISNTTYIYLDELQSILEKLLTLEESQKESYIKDIEKISKLLSENINSLNSKINNFEVEDIEVGINVLLQELSKESEENE